jgi:hypothetical protein
VTTASPPVEEVFQVNQNIDEVLQGDFRIVILDPSAMFPGINRRVYQCHFAIIGHSPKSGTMRALAGSHFSIPQGSSKTLSIQKHLNDAIREWKAMKNGCRLIDSVNDMELYITSPGYQI